MTTAPVATTTSTTTEVLLGITARATTTTTSTTSTTTTTTTAPTTTTTTLDVVLVETEAQALLGSGLEVMSELYHRRGTFDVDGETLAGVAPELAFQVVEDYEDVAGFIMFHPFDKAEGHVVMLVTVSAAGRYYCAIESAFTETLYGSGDDWDAAVDDCDHSSRERGWVY